MRSEARQPSDLIRSVSRALRVLEEVGRSPQGLNAKQIARRCGLALPTTYHLIRTLCYEGYLIRRPGGIYAIGYEISSRFRDLANALRQPAPVRAVMQHLATVTGHSVYLSRIVDDQVVLSEVVEAPGSPHLEDLVPGFAGSAHATALGKALLAAMRRSRRRSYLRAQGLPAVTSQTITDVERLEHELVRSRRLGFFTEHNQFRRDVSCAAVLVDDSTSLALSAATHRFASTGEDLVRALRVAAGDLVA